MGINKKKRFLFRRGGRVTIAEDYASAITLAQKVIRGKILGTAWTF